MTVDFATTRPHRRRVFHHFVLLLFTLVIGAAGTLAVVAWHQGYRIYVVHTGSMVPALNPGDAVLDRPASTSVSPGEIVTFGVHSGPDSVVTHRVASVSDGNIKTKGDANRSVDPWTVQASDVVGSKLLTLPFAGYLLVYLQHPQGIASVLTAVVALILLWQLFFPVEPPAGDAGDKSGSDRPRHKRDLARTTLNEAPVTMILPSARWLDVSRTQPALLRGGLGPLGRSSDPRSYFD
ncbi:MAG TPA: signal peptidase I [Acidothermaceae bacterium]|nr:signal peptidase I [Acidothermaceae bacterium]